MQLSVTNVSPIWLKFSHANAAQSGHMPAENRKFQGHLPFSPTQKTETAAPGRRRGTAVLVSVRPGRRKGLPHFGGSLDPNFRSGSAQGGGGAPPVLQQSLKGGERLCMSGPMGPVFLRRLQGGGGSRRYHEKPGRRRGFSNSNLMRRKPLRLQFHGYRNVTVPNLRAHDLKVRSVL